MTDWFLRILDGEFTSNTHGCVVWQDRAIMRTVNGGLDWTPAATTWSCPGGFVAISSGSPAGASWSEVTTSVTTRLNAVAYNKALVLPDKKTVYIVGDSGTVLRSDDDGQSWITRTFPVSEHLHGAAFWSKLGGCVVGANRTAYRTLDGGATWEQIGVVGGAAGEALLDVESWGDGSEAIAVGDRGNVYEKTSTRFVCLTLPFSVSDALYDVEVVPDGSRVRIGGNFRTVLMRDQGVWSRPWAKTNMAIYKVAFQSANQGYAIGRGSVIVEYQ